MNFNILTLGCKVNQYESQAMREDLISKGYLPSLNKDIADITVINSCTVTSVSDAKNRKLIHKIRRNNPDGIIVLTGCMPQAFPNELKNFSGCDIVLGNAKRKELVPAIERFISERSSFVNVSHHLDRGEQFEKLSVSSFGEHTRAFIKIEDGCNRFCSYCIIPYARGRVRSKPIEELRQEALRVSLNGYKEIVLVGINLSAYGLGEDFDLADAVECVCSVDSIKRVRLGSIEPEQMDDALIARLLAQKKFCPQFHLSLQSGCDKTLKAMNRHYTCEDYAEIVSKLRRAFPNPAITTDIMVGFAGESEEDFLQSVNFAKETGFAKAHIFPYSVREGTAAASFEDQVPPQEKERRARIMGEAVSQSRKSFLKSQIGRRESVLIERFRHKYLEGYTENYTPVRIYDGDKSMCGEIINVLITEAEDDYCVGKSV